MNRGGTRQIVRPLVATRRSRRDASSCFPAGSHDLRFAEIAETIRDFLEQLSDLAVLALAAQNIEVVLEVAQRVRQGHHRLTSFRQLAKKVGEWGSRLTD